MKTKMVSFCMLCVLLLMSVSMSSFALLAEKLDKIVINGNAQAGGGLRDGKGVDGCLTAEFNSNEFILTFAVPATDVNLIVLDMLGNIKYEATFNAVQGTVHSVDVSAWARDGYEFYITDPLGMYIFGDFFLEQ